MLSGKCDNCEKNYRGPVEAFTSQAGYFSNTKSESTRDRVYIEVRPYRNVSNRYDATECFERMYRPRGNATRRGNVGMMKVPAFLVSHCRCSLRPGNLNEQIRVRLALQWPRMRWPIVRLQPLAPDCELTINDEKADYYASGLALHCCRAGSNIRPIVQRSTRELRSHYSTRHVGDL